MQFIKKYLPVRQKWHRSFDIQKISKACASLETPKFKDKNHNVGCQGEFARLEKITP
jgi:hypothetical protein